MIVHPVVGMLIVLIEGLGIIILETGGQLLDPQIRSLVQTVEIAGRDEDSVGMSVELKDREDPSTLLLAVTDIDTPHQAQAAVVRDAG